MKMNEQELLRKTFDKLHASANVEKEILAMKESKRVMKLRPVAIAAMCACLLLGSAFAANAATDGAVIRTLRTVFGGQSIEITTLPTDEDVTVTLATLDITDVPDNAVAVVTLGENAGAFLTDDGRVMLREAGKDDVDVTDSWANGGSFTVGGKQIAVKAITDSNGNVAYECEGVGDTSADEWLYPSFLFDPDNFDLNALPGFEDVTIGSDVTVEGEVQGATAYTFTEVAED